jgi:gas vesicle protein
MGDVSNVILAIGGLITAVCSGIAAIITATRSSNRERHKASETSASKVVKQLRDAEDTEAELEHLRKELERYKPKGERESHDHTD